MLKDFIKFWHPRFLSSNIAPMWLLVGLGNPGSKYEKNRHNVGFMAIDQIASDYAFPAFRRKFDADISEGRIDGQRVTLIKPQTYMNESGRAVGPASKYFKVTPNQTIVFYDELDLAPGKLRVKKGGGTAGHNGLKSLNAHLGTPDYWRVRMGIGHPGDKARVSGHVLGDFSKEEQQWLGRWIDAAAKYVPDLLAHKQEDYMTNVARDCPAPTGEK